jgi:hypothetical protein
MGEMLQGDGNQYRGMLYGMTNRLGWSDKSDPRPLWKLWDEFGMQGTEMIGYWSDNCPVRSGNEMVPVTVYKKKGSALVSIASWADTTVDIHLQVDWKKLGIDSARATIVAPGIRDFQPDHIFSNDGTITIEKNKGWLLVIREQ